MLTWIPEINRIMKILINYATDNFHLRQVMNAETGYSVGKFDHVIKYSPGDIDDNFFQENKHILKHKKRGAGYWLWKPYIVKKTLMQISEGDFLFYADSASVFIGSIDPLIEKIKEINKDIMPFSPDTESRNKQTAVTKRDTFIIMNCDSPEYTNSLQIGAAFFLIRKTKNSVKIINEWLKYSRDERAITDIPNQCGKENYPDFKYHRHDQSIWSLVCKKHNISDIAYFSWITKEGDRKFPERNSDIDSCVLLYRRILK